MIIFENKFIESKGKPIIYNGKILQMMDVISMVKTEETIVLKFIKVNSEWKQGVALSTDGVFIVNNIECGRNVVLWEDTAPKEVVVIVKTKKKQFDLRNVWDVGDGTIHSWHAGAAMHINASEKIREYYCNDGHLDDNLNDLIFTIEKIG